MKRICFALALATVGVSSFAGDVGVSVSINQPGLYGRIDIGQAPTPPVLIYNQPVVIAPGPVAVQRQPIYLHVPPEHSRDWRRYCSRYSACGQPVYFVREDWYQTHYRHDRRDERDRRDRGHRDDRHDDDRRGQGRDSDHDRR